MSDEDLLLPNYRAPFGSGVIGVCDVCGKRQAVIVLQKERFKLCVLDFLNKSWLQSTAKPGAPVPPYRSERIWFDTTISSSGQATAILLSPTKIIRHPGVLITPDLYGLTTSVLDGAVRFARDGYEVLIPDLGKIAGIGFRDFLATRTGAYFWGGVSMENGRTQRIVRLFQDALAQLRTRPMVDATKIAVFGSGFGASLAIALSGAEQKLSAVVLAYPVPIRPADYMQLVTAPILFLAASRDRWSQASRRLFETAGNGLAFPVEYAEFPGTRHNFLARDLSRYDLPSAERAWQRALNFLRARLLPPPPKPPVMPRPAVPPSAPPVSLPPAPGSSAAPASAPAVGPAAPKATP